MKEIDDSLAAMESREESLRRLNEEICPRQKAKDAENSSNQEMLTSKSSIAPFSDDILDKCPPPMGAKATIRLQKAKIRALSCQVQTVVQAKEELEAKVEDLTERLLRNEEKQRHRLKLIQAKKSASKSQSSSVDTVESLRSELHAVKTELSSCQKSLKIADGEQKSRQLRLERALQEVNKYKKSVSEASKRNGPITNTSNVDTTKCDQLQRKVTLLERQKSELLVALKKESVLIDILKRQKIHAEAAKLLSFAEEAFVKEIGWGGGLSSSSADEKCV
mmetsp:Transcript_26102/g.56539  ORF Transcript_26102/g.56539 Transcript_26102/m.56539 type:complete len:278 (-) Transcript_26102:75-908(-)